MKHTHILVEIKMEGNNSFYSEEYFKYKINRLFDTTKTNVSNVENESRLITSVQIFSIDLYASDWYNKDYVKYLIYQSISCYDIYILDYYKDNKEIS